MHPENTKLKVVCHDPKRERLVKIFCAGLIVCLIMIAYWCGLNRAHDNLGNAKNHNQLLESKVMMLQEKNDDLLHRLDISESSSRIDRDAVNNVRLLVKELEEEKDQLQKELLFFKSIMAPEDMSTGVRVSDFMLLEGSVKGAYRIRLVISQLRRNNPLLQGTLMLSVIGENNGTVQTIPLQHLMTSDQVVTRLRFRYFQVIPDLREYIEFNIPENFIPKGVNVKIVITSGNKQSFEQFYQWDEELVADVRQKQNSE